MKGERAAVAHLHSVDDALGRDVNVKNPEIFLQVVPHERPATVHQVSNLEVGALQGNQMVLGYGGVEVAAHETTVARAVVHHLLRRLDVVVHHHAAGGPSVVIVAAHNADATERQTRWAHNLRCTSRDKHECRNT
jgi:hypothetical protein